MIAVKRTLGHLGCRFCALVMFMAEYQLYCIAQSGNAYRAALMLNLIGADWEPIWVDFFAGATRKPDYRDKINEMGEVPVLWCTERGSLPSRA